MKCKKAIMYLSLRLDNEILEEEENALEQHLASCDSCQKEWKMLQKQESILQNLKFPEPSNTFFDNFTVPISLPLEKKKKTTTSVWTRNIYAAVAAAILLFSYVGYSLVYVSKPTQKMFISLYKQERALWKKALIGNLQAQEQIVQYKNKTYGYILEQNRFLENEDFCLSVIQKDLNKPYPIAFEIYKHGKNKSLSLNVLCHIDLQSSLPLLLQCLEDDELSKISKSLLVSYENTAAPYLLNEMEKIAEVPKSWWSIIGSFSTAYAIPILEKYSSSGKYRKEALNALGKTNSYKAVELLISYWTNEELHFEIATSLKDLQPHSRKIMSYLLEKDDRTAIEIVGEMADTELVPHLLRLSMISTHRQKVISALAKIADPRTTEFFIQLTMTTKYRKLACTTLGELRNKDAIEFLLQGVKHNIYKSDCLHALKNVNDTIIIRPLVEIAYQQGMTHATMEILLGFPGQETIPYFIHMLSNSRLRSSAQRALKELTQQDFGSNAYLWKIWFERNKIS